MELTQFTRDAFVSALTTLKAAKVPFLVGGAFAINFYTGRLRNTKDIDLFLCKSDLDRAVAALGKANFLTRIEDDHWLAKAFKNDNLIDLIYGSGNWVFHIDQSFFDRGPKGKVLDVPVRLLAPEEIIWSKAYVGARERFDGADIAHLISATKGKLDWSHLLNRFDDDWQLLFSDLLLFGFVYPSERDYVPQWLWQELVDKTRQTIAEKPPQEKTCRGTLLDRLSFVYDIDHEGYKDPREGLAERLGYSPEGVIADRERAEAELEARLKH